MAQTISFEFEGKEYILEYTRRSVETMERQGFVAADIASKPMTTIPALFAGAFIAHHRSTRRDVIDRIFGKLGNKDKLIETLAGMYNETLETLMNDDEDEGNVSWETSK